MSWIFAACNSVLVVIWQMANDYHCDDVFELEEGFDSNHFSGVEGFEIFVNVLEEVIGFWKDVYAFVEESNFLKDVFALGTKSEKCFLFFLVIGYDDLVAVVVSGSVCLWNCSFFGEEIDSEL